MRRILMVAGLGIVILLGLLWITGAMDIFARDLQLVQRSVQDRLAGAIRALRAGEPGALLGFWTACFGYGVLHAVGPGHGKMVIGGYGLARRVPVGRLAGLALASSLAQAAVAVGLVYAVIGILGLTRSAVQGVADQYIAPIGYVSIGGLGLWLVWRGARTLLRKRRHDGHDHAHDHHHGHHHRDHAGDHGPDCGHAHGPTLEQVERVGGWRDGLMLIAGIALRPCTGALFVLVLAFQLGIANAGIVGAFVMGLGTAVVTVSSALLAVWAREGAFESFGSARFALLVPVIEVTVGALIAIIAGDLLLTSV